MVTIREYIDSDLIPLENILRRSMMSILPRYGKIISFELLILIFFLNFGKILCAWILFIGILFELIIYGAYYWQLQKYLAQVSLLKNIHKYRTPYKRNKILVLVDGAKPIGFTSILEYSAEIGWTTYMFIDPNYQKRGYGLKLNEALFTYGFEQLGYLQIKGATSSLQINQIKLQKKYAKILANRVPSKLTLEYKKIYGCVPIYRVYIIYTYNGK